MTNEEAQIIIGNIPIKPEVLDDCYDITEYQEAKAMAIKALEQTDKIEESNFSTEQYKADLQAAYDCGYNCGYADARNDIAESEVQE